MPETAAPVVPDWRPRRHPTAASAVLGVGRDQLDHLLAALERLVAAGVPCAAAADAGHLLVVAPTEELPWFDGARYLARSGRLFVPTNLEPRPEQLVLAAAEAALDGASVGVLAPGRLLRLEEPVGPVDLVAVRTVLDGEAPAS